jgi:RNA polymerase sigma-70 factor, ECF subfamily
MDRIADFRELFECHFTPLVKYAYFITGDKDQSKDIVQNFFVEIWRTKKIDTIQSFEAFAFLSIRNKSLTYLRSRKKFDLVVPDIPMEDNHIGQDSHFPEYLLESAIRRLPEKCQEVFVLSKLEGLTYQEVAARLNVSVKTVEKHVGVGLRKLKKSLAPYKESFLEDYR